jgi:hypothetical protein
MLTMAGYICPSCHGDADDADPTEECSMCGGHVPERAPFTPWTRIGPIDKCFRCGGKGRVKKMSVQMAEFDAKLTPEARKTLQEIRKKFKEKKLKLGEKTNE